MDSETKPDDLASSKLEQANRLFQTAVSLIYGKRKSIDKAIKCIQKAITLADKDYKYWQLLGEAYYQRGSLNPAINCFNKSLALAEQSIENLSMDEQEISRLRADCTYSRLRMSDIRLSVSHLDEARSGYEDIIANDKENVAALIGLSKTELQVARNCFSSNLVKTGHKHCMDALKYALMATKLKPNLCLNWKLASDCCIIQFVYGQRGDFRARLDIQFPGSGTDGLMIDRSTCIDLAQQFLSRAIEIAPYQNSACLWHNLGISLYLKSNLIEDFKSTVKQDLLRMSLKCLIRALSYDRINAQIRNSIGLIAFQMNFLNTAQSFIIKSIQTNLSTSELQFSNLGYIYLQKGEYRLAGVAFSRCQAEEPLYSRSWLGNALINETNSSDNLSLLRHCHKLEHNYESQIMYATKVTSLPKTIDYNKDIINSLECMRNLVNFDRSSVGLSNTLGLLYESSGFKTQAMNSFSEALELSPKEPRIIFNRLRQHRADRTECGITDRINSADLSFIQAAQQLVNAGSNSEFLLNYIFYLFTNKDYRNLNPMITKYVQNLTEKEVRNKIGAQIVLALIAKEEGGDFKSWLFKNIIDSESILCIESVINLYSLLLIGLIFDDSQLVEQISQDLKRYLSSYISTRNQSYLKILYSNDGYWIQMAIICSIITDKNPTNLIHPMVVLFPDVAENWLYMGMALIFEKTKKQTTQHQMAIHCLKKAKLLESNNANLSVICDILLSILIASEKKTSQESSITYLCRAVYKWPDNDILWVALNERKLNSGQMKPKLEDKKGKDAKAQSLIAGFSHSDLNLLQLSIDRTIQMIKSV